MEKHHKSSRSQNTRAEDRPATPAEQDTTAGPATPPERLPSLVSSGQKEQTPGKLVPRKKMDAHIPAIPASEKTIHTYPPWIPTAVTEALIPVMEKPPLDLASVAPTDPHFANIAEVEDITDILRTISEPVFVGLGGSRASLVRPPLFRTVDDFDRYHLHAAGQLRTDLPSYLAEYNLTLSDYDEARALLESGNFPATYGKQPVYPPEIVQLLVRDIDIFILANTETIAGKQRGARTHVPIELQTVTPSSARSPFRDLQDLTAYIEMGLRNTIPLTGFKK